MRRSPFSVTAMPVLPAILLAFGCENSDPVSPPSDPDPPVAVPGPDRDAAPKDIVYFGGGGLNIVKSDGSGATRLLDGGYSPSWSPDGRRVAFSDRACETDWMEYYRCVSGGITVINPETGDVVALPGGALGEHPDWDPTGNLIAFVRHTESGQGLFVMRSDGTEARQIPTPGIINVYKPSWSPDGARIAFQCPKSGMGICIVNRDGSGLMQLNIGQTAASPAWSPDGSRIAFTIFSDGQGRIAIIPSDGGAVTPIADGLGPAWSRDGRTLAFSRNNDGLFRIDIDGRNLRRLTTGLHGSPSWRP